MRLGHALAGTSLAVLLAATPAHAAITGIDADPEVQRLEAALEQARAAAAGREVEAARREAEAANQRLAVAETTRLQLAAAQTPPAAAAPAPDPAARTVNGAAPQVTGRREFGGIEFGVGLSFTLDVGSSDRVSEAALVNGIVRVQDKDNGVARIMLESHYFFTPGAQGGRGLFGVENGAWGHGPFVAIQPGTDDIIEAIAAGWMVGFRRPVAQGGEDTGQSFNFGLGIVVDPNSRILGDGIVANEPLPAGETEIRYTEEMQTGILFLFSFSF